MVSTLEYILRVLDDSLVRVGCAMIIVLGSGMFIRQQIMRMQMLDYESHGSKVGGAGVEGTIG